MFEARARDYVVPAGPLLRRAHAGPHVRALVVRRLHLELGVRQPHLVAVLLQHQLRRGVLGGELELRAGGRRAQQHGEGVALVGPDRVLLRLRGGRQDGRAG